MKKLGQMSKRIDDVKTGRTIRCLMIEDYKTSTIKKIRDPKLFKQVIEETDEELLTKVYQPTEKDKLDLINYIQSHSVDEKGNKRFTAKDEEVYMWLLRFTDIEPSDNEEENLNAINNPSELLIQVSQELSSIMMQIISNYQEVKRTYDSLPDEMIETLIENEKQLNGKSEEQLQAEKELEELREKMKLLESKVNG